jgi:hypothetical protein
MGRMKITAGPRYQKTGSPTQKKDRQIRLLMTAIFQELASAQVKPHEKQEGLLYRRRE